MAADISEEVNKPDRQRETLDSIKGRDQSDGVAELGPGEADEQDDEVEKIVRKCWETIEDQRQNELSERRKWKELDKPSRGWKTIRVFVSSTFLDMHSEREVLVKKVEYYL